MAQTATPQETPPRGRFYGLRWPVVRALLKLGLWRKLANYLLAELQLRLRLEKAIAKPYWLVLDPNSGCDLKCPFCPTGRGDKGRTRQLAKLEHVKNVLDQLGPYLLHIEFSDWGEPLLNPKIFEMVAYAKKFGVEVHFSTNFNTFNEEMAEKMLDCGLDWLVVSIDGASPETYAKYRVGGDYERVMSNLRTLIAAKQRRKTQKPVIGWQMLVFRHNEHEIERAKRIGYFMGVDRVAASPASILDPEWMPVGPGKALYPEVLEKGTTQVTNPLDFEKAAKEETPFCVWPWIGATVNATSSLSPCCVIEYDKDDFGMLSERKFDGLWNGEDYLAARRWVGGRVKGERKNACTECKVIGKANMHVPDWWGTGDYQRTTFDLVVKDKEIPTPPWWTPVTGLLVEDFLRPLEPGS